MAGTFASASSQHLQVGSSPVAAAYPLTMACWANLTSVAATQALIWTGNSAAANHYMTLELRSTGFVGATVRNTTVFTASSSAAPSANTWFHACGAFSSSTLRTAYLNGGNSGTNTSSSTPTTFNRTNIGRYGSSVPTNYADGLIAEAAIWDQVLDASEVASLAAGVCPLLVRPTALIFYAPLVRTLTADIRGGLTLSNSAGVTVGDHPRIIRPSNVRMRRFTTAAAAATSYHRNLPLLGVG